ncbi:hypothetical protein LBMAG51_02770 [Phycisphaerae bacterium]|nr:hypothetical protein LBMAG51_02770 [Phycisphaerae bacterium]
MQIADDLASNALRFSPVHRIAEKKADELIACLQIVREEYFENVRLSFPEVYGVNIRLLYLQTYDF